MAGNIWARVLDRLQSTIIRSNYDTWLTPTSFAADDGTTIEVRVPEKAFADWNTKHYGAAIQEALTALGRPGANVSFVVGPPVAEGKPTAGKRLQGKALTWETIEPWHEPVDGATLLETIVEAFERFVTLPEHGATALALWVTFTYTQDAAYVSPILAITSPMKQCGKSTVLSVLSSIVYRRQVASNLTQGVLFRFIDRYAPTLLIDEADTFLPGNDALRGILNSGHTRTTARLIRNIGDDYEPREFTTWCPKAIALIGRLPGTLEDRSIQLQMRRQRRGEHRYRRERCPREDRLDTRHLPLRRQLTRWANDNLDALHQHGEPEVPESLSDRMGDNWRPLMTIAEVCGGDWPARARAAAVALSGATFKQDQEPAVELLKDLYLLLYEPEKDGPALAAGEDGVVPTKDVLGALAALEDRPWSTWRADKPMTGAALARVLGSLDIHADGLAGRSRSRGYLREAFDDAFSRYLPIEVIKRSNPNVYGPKLQIQSDPEDPSRITLKSEKTPVFIDDGSPDHFDQGKSGVLPILPAIRRQIAKAGLQAVTPHHRVHARTSSAPKGR
jgi:hypothetical protein